MKVVIYDVLTGEIVRTLPKHSGVVRDVSWHPYYANIIASDVSVIIFNTNLMEIFTNCLIANCECLLFNLPVTKWSGEITKWYYADETCLEDCDTKPLRRSLRLKEKKRTTSESGDSSRSSFFS